MKKTIFQFRVLCRCEVAIQHKREKYWINAYCYYLSWPAHKEFISIEEKIMTV